MAIKPILADAAFSLMLGHLDRASTSMFHDCGIEVLRLPKGPDGDWASSEDEEHLGAATIGFTAAGMRGALVLVAAIGAVRSWRNDDVRLDDHALHDTVAEFANMLLGQLKRGLLAEGIELHMATPTAFCARSLSLPKAGLQHSGWHLLTSAGGRIGVRLDAAFDGPCLAVEQGHRPAPAEAGDMMFF